MNNSLIDKTATTFHTTIYIAGNYNTALDILQKYCENGMCVSCQPTDYIYKYGREAGIAVTLINYPLYPMSVDKWKYTAREIGNYLMEELSQGSYTTEFADETEFYSRRQADKN